MKKTLLLLSLSFHCMFMYCQDFMSDVEFNHPKVAEYINNTFVKSFIGFDMKQISGFISKTTLKEPLIINGVEYKAKTVVSCDKKIKFITLDEIRKQYHPEVSGPVVYMINKFFITKDAESYKLDKEFIEKCDILPSTEFELLKDQKAFSIIRIFTKNDNKSVIIR